MDDYTSDLDINNEGIPTASKLRKLLKPYKVVRDPIHGDIKLTRLETAIIDTRGFQRLRTIEQLGPSSQVYPGAVHNRFEHSIGTLWDAQNMFDKINQNGNEYPNLYFPLDEYTRLLTRLFALVHDVAHIPFGHTLEDEGNNFPSQWEDESRIEHFLGNESEIGKKIKEYAGIKTLEKLREIVLAKKEDEIKKLEFPIVADIVANTICADLLDYVERDLYYSGLKGGYDKRFLEYLTAQKIDDSNKLRLVMPLFKTEKEGYRRDVVSEILLLLRLRYSISEKIYYHHAKIAASAMIIEAVNIALQGNKNWLMKDIFSIGDQELLHKLELEDESPVGTKFIANHYRNRSLYKPIYLVSYKQVSTGDKSSLVKDEKTNELAKNPLQRYDLARKLERNSFLPEGSIIIYCPPKGMGRKIAEAKVGWGDKIHLLKDVKHYDIGKQTEEIVKRHEELWTLQVFISPKYYEMPQVRNVVIDFYTETGLEQELKKFDLKEMISLPPHEKVVYSFLNKQDKKTKEKITPDIIQSMLQIANTPSPNQKEPKILADNELQNVFGKLMNDHNRND